MILRWSSLFISLLLLLSLVSIAHGTSWYIIENYLRMPPEMFKRCHETVCLVLNSDKALSQVYEKTYERHGLWIEVIDDAHIYVTIAQPREYYKYFSIGNTTVECGGTQYTLNVNDRTIRNELFFSGSYDSYYCKVNLVYFSTDEETIGEAFQLFLEKETLIMLKTSPYADNGIRVSARLHPRLTFTASTTEIARAEEADQDKELDSIFECKAARPTILLNDKVVKTFDDKDFRIYASQTGWFGKKSDNLYGKIAKFTGAKPFCVNLCAREFIVLNRINDVEPVYDYGSNSLRCVDGSVKVDGSFYAKVECADGKWKSGESVIKVDDHFRFQAECFGPFIFLDKNCEDSAELKSGCVKPILTGATLNCPENYLLSLNDRIYRELLLEGADWKEKGQKVGPANVNERPMCWNKCAHAHFQADHSDESSMATYLDGGELKCASTNQFKIVSLKPGEVLKSFVCDAKRGFIVDGQVLRDFTNVKSLDELKFAAHCFAPCSADQGSKPSAEAIAPIVDGVSYTCPEGEFSDIFIGDENKHVSKVECTVDGWLDGSGNNLGDRNKGAFCYSDNPPNILPQFLEKCRGEKVCVIYDNPEAPTSLLLHTESSAPKTLYGLDLNTANLHEWELKIAVPESAENCEITIGGLLKFKFNDDQEKKIEGVTIKRISTLTRDEIKYAKFQLVATDDYVVDRLKLYRDEPKITLNMDIGGDSLELKSPEIKIKGVCETLPEPRKKPFEESVEAVRADNKYSCTAPLAEIWLDKLYADSAAVYCSRAGYRLEDGSLLASGEDLLKLQPYCYSSTPPNILPLYENCEEQTRKCFVFNNEKVPSKLAVYTSGTVPRELIGMEINTKNGQEWILKIAIEASSKSCNVEFGEVLNFACEDSENAGVKVTRLSYVVLDGIRFEKYKITPMEASTTLVDALRLYKDEVRAKLTYDFISSPLAMSSAPVNMRQACATPTEDKSPGDEALEATVKDSQYSCEDSIFDIIYIGSTNTGVSVVYCSDGGWRTDDGLLVGESNVIPSCYSPEAPGILPLFKDCSKDWICFHFDKSTPPKLIDWTEGTSAPLGISMLPVNFNNETSSEMTVKFAFPLDSGCRFSLGILVMNCFRGSADEGENGVSTNIVSQYYLNYMPNKKFLPMNYTLNSIFWNKQKIVPRFSVYSLFDALQLYREPAIIKLDLGRYGIFISQHPIDFGFECPTPSRIESPGFEAIEPIKTHFKYSCTAPLGEIFLGEKNTGGSTVYCSTEGWRNEAGDYIDHNDVKPFCYSVFLFLGDNLKTEKKREEGCDEPILKDNVISCNDGYLLSLNGRVQQQLILKHGKWFDGAWSSIKSFEKTDKILCSSRCMLSYIIDNRSTDKMETEVIYKFDRTSNSGKLSCADPTYFIVSNLTGKASRSDSNLICDKSGWRDGSAILKDLTNVSTTDQLLMGAHCYKVCDTLRVTSSCDGDYDCENATSFKSPDWKLACGDHRLLNVDGVLHAKPLQCTQSGWMVEGGSLVPGYDSATMFNAILKVGCWSKCNPHFISDSCNSSSCSPFKLDNRVLSCGHKDEILIIEHATLPKGESFDKLTCSEAGWNNDKGEMVMALPDSEPDFNVRVRCEQVCHESTLKPLDKKCATDKNTTECLRRYNLDGILTCDVIRDSNGSISSDTMIEFSTLTEPNKKHPFSEVTCSKKGWLNTFTNETIIKFAPNASRPTIDVNCVKSPCVRKASLDICKGDIGNCQKPDDKKVKYQLSCDNPSRIMSEAENVQRQDLRCKIDGWYEIKNDGTSKERVLEHTKNYDFYCKAGKCAKCLDSKVTVLKCDGDENCEQPEFNQGAFTYCSKFSCPKDHGYKIKEGSEYRYLPSDGSRKVSADDQCNFNIQGHEPPVHTLGCVKYIPCTEHTLLNTFDDDLMKILRASERITKTQKSPRAAKCTGQLTLYQLSNEAEHKWEKLKFIKCNSEGKWDVVYENSNITEKILDNKKQLKCSDIDPSATTLPPTTQPSTTPPIDQSKACQYCPDLALLSCKECLEEIDAITKTNENNKCTAKSSTGLLAYNDDRSETGDIECALDENTGKFEWKARDGTVVERYAAKKKTLLQSINTGQVVAIVIVPILIILIIAGVLGTWYWRRRKAQIAAEESKNKMTEQKNDAIIDDASLDAPKTVIL